MARLLARDGRRYSYPRWLPSAQSRSFGSDIALIGWAQVHGRAALPWDDRIDLDVWYVENRSVWLDLKILARTPGALLTGTYKGATGGWRS
jgi:lipopolysaccharide/colanic/teichoic acid biosynthesis glycosyltransferase